MGLLDSFKAGIQNHFNKRKEEREMIEKLQLEAKIQEKQTFEEEFKKYAKDVAISKAKKDAARLSGYQKLKAANRLRNLQRTDMATPMGFFEKIQVHTQKNLARREENLKRTTELREIAKKEREKRMLNRPIPRKPFAPKYT